MKCDAAQNRLLALPDPDRPPDSVRDHLAGCPDCRRFREQAARLDARLAALPAPSAAARKEAFLDSLLAAGPVITAVPAPPPRAGRSLRELLAEVRWKPVGSVAAVALVGLGVWNLRPGPTPPAAEVPGPRAVLVSRVLGYQKDLALETDALKRMDRLAALAADLEREARDVSLAAGKDELRELAGMYEKVVKDGVVGQARGVPPQAKRPPHRQAFTDAARRLGEAAAALDAQAAPKDAKESLAKMAAAARAARTELTQLAGGT